MHSLVLALAAILSPPEGLTKTNVTLSDVLQRHAAVQPPLQSARETWSVTFGQMQGTLVDTWSGDRERSDQDFGTFHTAYGSTESTDWHMDENGDVVRESGLHLRDAIDARALAHATAPNSGVRLLGTVTSPVSAFVVEVSPPGGRHEYLYYDRVSYRLVRREEERDGRRYVISYDDFRPVGSTSVPYHLVTEDGKPENRRDETLTTISPNAAIGDADLAMPTPGPSIVSFTGDAHAVPATLDADRIVLPFVIGGHHVDMLLDSGASGIVINDDVVHALGYHEYGRVIGSTAGDYSESSVIIPRMTLGPVTISNAYASSLPFVQSSDDGRPIAGLMGFDVLNRMVVHVDYQNQTVEAFDPATFTPPSNATMIPVALDDNVPALMLTLNGTRLRFILDTGADRSLLFSSCLAAHPDRFPEQGLGAAIEASSPFVDTFSGVGGDVEYRPLQTGPLQVGAWTFDTWLFQVTQNDPSFESEDYDGLIGQDFLRNFDLYLDLSHGRVFLVPNARYHDRWG